MIRVNLLPMERRRAERTPLPRFLILIGGLAVVGAMAVLLIFTLNERSRLEGEVATLQSTIQGQQKGLKQFDSLTGDIVRQETRSKAVQEVSEQRHFLWSRAFDEIWDVIFKSPGIWLTSWKVVGDKTVNKRVVRNQVSMEVLAAGDDVFLMTEFRKRLRQNSWITSMFNGISDPKQYAIQKMPNTVEGAAVKFKVELYDFAPETAKKKK